MLSYYDLVERIVVSYDADGLGWTGAAVDVEQCLGRLRAIDRDSKMEFRPGHFARPEFFGRPMENDTHQRQVALDEAGVGADWVLQLDTDEVLPQSNKLADVLTRPQPGDAVAVEWPMRVLFRQLRDGRYLEVCATDGTDRYEYPGPIAVRPGVRLTDARRCEGATIRPVVRSDASSLQIASPPGPFEHRTLSIEPSEAIVHNSWARTATEVKSKVASWSHADGWRTRAFYYLRWRPAPWAWRITRDFHPFAHGLWPALKVSTQASRCAPDVLNGWGRR